MELSSLLKKSSVINVPYPDPEFKDLVIQVAYTSREEMLKLRKECITHTYNKKTRAMDETVDEEKFTNAYVSAILKGWTGFKYKYLVELLPIDTSKIDLEADFEYSDTNAVVLMQNSSIFEAVVGDVVADVAAFSKA